MSSLSDVLGPLHTLRNDELQVVKAEVERELRERVRTEPVATSTGKKPVAGGRSQR